MLYLMLGLLLFVAGSLAVLISVSERHEAKKRTILTIDTKDKP